MPLRILEPDTAPAAAAMLAACTAEGVGVMPRGCGSKLSWGRQPRVDTVLSTRRLSTPIQHYPGDLVATLPAGATLAEVNAVLAEERQWLPLDPPDGAHATIGGVVATNDSGPRRQQHGATRDLIIGVEIALADGRQAKAGGRVVKNVAGYDLARLMCGSFGTLAVITSATFKLAPLAPASRTVVIETKDPAAASELALAINAAPLSPSAIEVQGPPLRLLIRFETTEAAAQRQAQRVVEISNRSGHASTIVHPAEEAEIWRHHEGLVWRPGGMVVKVTVLPTEVGAVLSALHQRADRSGSAWAAIGRAALGVLIVRVDGPDEEAAAAVALLRTVAIRRGGAAVVVRSPASLVDRLDPWGDPGGAAAMMQAVKTRFDPRNTLSPGRGPAGLS